MSLMSPSSRVSKEQLKPPSPWQKFIEGAVDWGQAIADKTGASAAATAKVPDNSVETQKNRLKQAARDKQRIIDIQNQEPGSNPLTRAMGPLGTPVEKVNEVSTDLLLHIAKFANEKLISPVLRSASTVAIATDPNSPLYKKEELGVGFQPKDIVTAWNQSKKVSLGQALASNPFTNSNVKGVSGIQAVSDFFGGPDFGKVNVFSESSIKENYEENIFGKYFTGATDVAAAGGVFSAAGKGLGALGRFAATESGLVAKGGRLEKAQKFETDVEVGLQHIQSGGVMGIPTNAARDVSKIAAATTPTDVYEVFRPYSNNRELIPFLVKETDPKKIADIILADNKYLPAMERVLTDDSVVAWAALGGHEAMVSKMWQSGGTFAPEDAVMQHIRDLHVKSINEIPEHKALWDALMEPDPYKNAALGLGKDTYKIEGSIGRVAENVRGFTTQYVGSHNNAVTQIVRIAGTRLPRGYVSFSKTRTWDGVEELKSEFDNVKLFNNPDNIIKTSAVDSMTVKQFRDEAHAGYLAQTTDAGRYQFMKELDLKMGESLARSMGITKMEDVKQIITEMQNKLFRAHQSATQTGYGMDIGGDFIQLDMYAQTQLANAYRLVPWGQVERELIYSTAGSLKAAKMKSADFTLSLFNSIIKGLSAVMIAKPSYIFKQSMLEPTIGATIAMGPGYVTSSIGGGIVNAATNTTRRATEIIMKTKGLTNGERRSATREITNVGNELSAQIDRHNLLTAEFDAFFISKTKTGKTVEIHGPEVIAQYKASAKAVKLLEEKYRLATIRWGVAPEIQSEATAMRKLDFLEKAGLSPEIYNQIQIIRSGLSANKAYGRTVFSDSTDIAAKEEALRVSYSEIDRILAKLSTAQKAHYQSLEKTARLKERSYGKGERYEFIDGQYMLMPKVFDDNTVGASLRAETSNAPTVLLNYSSEITRSVRDGIYRRHRPGIITRVDDPRYYDELATLINQQWKQDDFYRPILAGGTREEMIAWARQGEGLTYMNKMDIASDEVVDFVDDAFARVNTYLPSVELQRAIANGTVLAPGYEKFLHPHVGQLMPIHPRDFNYLEANLGIGHNKMQTVMDFTNRFLDKTFKTLMKYENPLRWSYLEQQSTRITAEKANMLAQQGKTIGPEDLNALQQASFQEAVADMEKTFYTITRANKIIYQTRLLTMFPTASANAFYRYSRLAVQNPTRTLGFLHFYNSMFTSFGVDQYGNPTDDVMKVTHIVVPGTKDMGLFDGEGMKIGVKSIGFILNAPTLGPIMTIPIGKIVDAKPSFDVSLQKILGQEGYKALFPYGTTSATVERTVIPAWARDLTTWIKGSSGTDAFRISLQSIYDYHRVLVTMGIEKEMPTSKRLEREASDLWGQRGRYEFFSPTGMPIKIETSPMTLYRQVYYNLMNQNRANGMSMDDSQKKAERDFLMAVGPMFPMNVVTFTGNPSRAYIAKTQEGFDRVYSKHVELTKQLVHIFPKDPFIVSLLTADIEVNSENRSQVIIKKLAGKEMTLPDINGTIMLNEANLSPQQVQEQRDNKATWDAFFVYKELLNESAMTKRNSRGEFYKSMDSIPKYRAALKDYAENTLGKKNPTWLSQNYRAGGGANRTYIYATGFDMVVRDNKFMKENGNKPYWKDALDFTQARNHYVELYYKYPEGENRTAVKKAYAAYIFGDAERGIEGRIGTYDPKLQKIITRYFLDDTMVKVGERIG